MRGEWLKCCGRWCQRQKRDQEGKGMILYVIILHWWDGRECTAGQFQLNDVYRRQTGERCSLLEVRWSMRRDLTTRSIILDTTERLKIGRQLENSSLSKVDFLSCGEMRVSLRMGHATHPYLPLSFTLGLKPTCFSSQILPPRSVTSSSQTAFTDFCPDCFFWATRFLCF